MMELADEELQRIEDLSKYRTAVKSVRGTAWGGVIFGGLMALGGYSGLGDHPLNAVVLLMGLALLITAVWLLTVPSLKGVMGNGVLLALVGLWNIAITMFELLEGGIDSSQPMWIIFGLFQIRWARNSFKIYKNLSGKFPEPPPEAELKSIDELLTGLRRSKIWKAKDVVEFTKVSFLAGKVKWRGLLLDDFALFLGKGDEVLCARKDRVTIVPERKLAMQKTLKAVLRVNQEESNILISGKSLANYAAWKEAAPAAESSPDPQLAHPDSG